MNNQHKESNKYQIKERGFNVHVYRVRYALSLFCRGEVWPLLGNLIGIQMILCITWAN